MTWQPSECNSIQEQAAMMHELWISFISEGFTKHEASHIIMNVPMCCQDDAPA